MVSINETIDRRPLAARIVRELVPVVDAVADFGAVLPDAIEGKILDGRPLAGCSTGTSTSTTVPSLIFTSSRGQKTPFSYLAAIVMALDQS
jgi:hypothetical protein